jgi:formate hydrogenlyase subunit 4
MGGPIPLAGAADAILLIYLLTLAGFATLLAGLAAGSPYSVVGMSRGMMAMLVLEPVLAVSILVAAVETGSLGLPAVLAASVYSADAAPLAGLLVLGVLLLALQAFVERVPFDTAEAETEIMEGALLEYSGPKLALFRYARGVRLYVYVVLVVSLVSPLGRGLSPLLGFLVCLGQVFALILLVTAVAATHARYRIDQAIRYYASLLALGVGALVLALAGF